MLLSDNSEYDYSFPVTLEDGTESILFTSEEFKSIIMMQYTSFGLYSPSYYDSDQKKIVSIIEDTDAAIEKLNELFTLWIKDRKSGISKMLDALRKNYNPIWNVDGVEGTIHQSTHTGTDTDKKTGTDTTSGSETGTVTNTGKSTNTRTGNETDTPTGKDINTGFNTTFDSSTFRDTQKTEASFENRIDTHTYNEVKDTFEVDSENPTTETRNLANGGSTQYNSQTQKTLNLKDEDLDMKIRQGNIGVTSTQSLIRQQIDLTDLDDIITYAIHDFVHRYLIILS
jgi:hypothetical protein